MRVVVVGGRGLIGAQVTAQLERSGQTVVVASRRTGVDTVTGRGVDEAVAGADVVIDVTRPQTSAAPEVIDFFLTSTRHLLAAEDAGGVGHHLALSVVGTERLLTSSWFRAKIVQESLVRSGPIPHTIVRATQFFEFLPALADHATEGTTVRLPPVLVQPIAGADVAAAVASSARGAPAGGIVEVAGPETFELPEVVAGVLRRTDDDRSVVADESAAYFGADAGQRTLLPGSGARLGEIRLTDWLAQRER